MKRTDRWIGLVVMGLLLGLGIAAISWFNLPAPQLANPTAGLLGPLTLVFADAMQAQSVEQRLSLEPSVPGHWSWQGGSSSGGRYTIAFWPDDPLTAGQAYTVRLGAGARAQNGRTLLRSQAWQVTIRPPAVLYLSPSRAPELWRVSADGQERDQLTAMGGKVFYYAISPDGALITVSVRNNQQGLDLWEMDRNGGSPRLLLPCGADWCIQPAYAPDSSRIAYSRRKASGALGSDPGMARLWLLDRATLSTDSPYVDPNIGGAEPAWSPDGHFLAVVDEAAPGVRVLDLQNKIDFLLPAGEGSALAWSPDGRILYYTAPEAGEEQPSILVYAVNVQTRQSSRILGSPDEADGLEYSVPAPSPDGAWLAYARRQVAGIPGKQLWLQKLDGSQLQAISDDPLSNAAGYHWDPGGSGLVFQRLSLGASSSRPQVMVWDRSDGSSSGSVRLLAEDAFQPDWLP